jgi:ligand-binding sensor domain-containing protein
MPKPNLHQKLQILLLLFFFATVCNGQAKIKRTQSTGYSQVGCSLLDKAGNLWFGTPNEGVYKYNGKVFSQFSTQNGLANNDVSAIIEDKTGNILIGTKGGICKYDGKSFAPYTDINDPSKKPISSLFEDKEGHLWFGVWGQGIYMYDGKIFTNFLNNQSHNLGNRYQLILDILQDKKGNMWFSSWNGGGVWRYDPSAKLSADGKAFKNFLPSLDYYKTNQDKRSGNAQNLSLFLNNSLFTQSKDYIADDMIFSMTEDKSGNIWFATRNHGACRFDGKIFTEFGTKEGFLSTNAYAILEDKKGNMWFTTEKDGVWRYDPKQAVEKTFKNFTTKDGLANDSVFSILEDKNGNIWFGTRGFGLCSYNGKIFTNYSE